jgi:hypothetical protein
VTPRRNRSGQTGSTATNDDDVSLLHCLCSFFVLSQSGKLVPI